MFDYFFKLLQKFKFHYHLFRIACIAPEDLRTCMMIPRLILCRMRNVSERSCRESQNTNMFFNFSENLASYDSIEKYGAALLVIHDHIMLHQKGSLGMPDK